ncbi:unnamed protein product [Rodentolepis nana]|uniref:Saposin B-type domain-containing protein n=1 Tax=Rodentolepis nana TaxID=102285 RepID=A0A0R3T4G7_RODNA|nr:unnamed protein product [Rodentolepis nana]
MKAFVILTTLCGLVLLFGNARSRKLSLEQFEACIKECSNQYEECIEITKDLWHNFYKNRKNISKIVNSCCMKNEKKENALATDSFATCTRVKCGSQLYGCKIVRKHEGAFSKDEKDNMGHK